MSSVALSLYPCARITNLLHDLSCPRGLSRTGRRSTGGAAGYAGGTANARHPSPDTGTQLGLYSV